MRDFLRGLGAELRGIRAELTPNWMRPRRRGVVAYRQETAPRTTPAPRSGDARKPDAGGGVRPHG
jgi:hypothetical protein